MSAYHEIFIHTAEPLDVLLADLATASGAELRPRDGTPVDYSVGLEHAAVELELQHDFEEDFGIPFERYERVVTIRDFDRDKDREEALARRLYASLTSTGRYRLVLVYNLQRLLAASPPLT